MTDAEEKELNVAIAGLDRHVPVALLPVRLETKFIRPGSGGIGSTDLLIRIYPDDIHQDTFEPKLSVDEISFGHAFWIAVWRAGMPKTGESAKETEDRNRAQQNAWRVLVTRFGAHRAAWVARALRPTNEAERPPDPRKEDQELDPAPNIPTPTDKPNTPAPQARLMPDRWTVFGYRAGERVFAELSKPIAALIATGFDPTAQWKVNFDTALDLGMAVAVRSIPDVDADQGFDQIIAFGVRWSSNKDDSARSLGELLRAHRYTWGLGVVPPGTPTNNTEEIRAGHTAFDPEAEGGILGELSSVPNPLSAGSDAQVLEQVLGLPSETLGGIENGDGSSQPDAALINKVFWPATWGYYLDQLLSSDLFKVANVDVKAFREKLHEHFLNHVRACGPVPTIRVGNQPYGILPVTSLSAWRAQGVPVPDPNAAIDTETGAVNLLAGLQQVWRKSVGAVPRIDSAVAPEDATSRLTSLLGMVAQSVKLPYPTVCRPDVRAVRVLVAVRGTKRKQVESDGIRMGKDCSKCHATRLGSSEQCVQKY